MKGYALRYNCLGTQEYKFLKFSRDAEDCQFMETFEQGTRFNSVTDAITALQKYAKYSRSVISRVDILIVERINRYEARILE